MVWWDHTIFLILPSQQRFRSDQFFFFCIHHRLIHQKEALIPAHDRCTDGMEFFNPVAVLVREIVQKLYQLSLSAYLGFSVGKIQAGIHSLIIHFKMIYHQHSGIQIQDHILIFHRDPVPEIVPK